MDDFEIVFVIAVILVIHLKQLMFESLGISKMWSAIVVL